MSLSTVWKELEIRSSSFSSVPVNQFQSNATTTDSIISAKSTNITSTKMILWPLHWVCVLAGFWIGEYFAAVLSPPMSKIFSPLIWPLFVPNSPESYIWWGCVVWRHICFRCSDRLKWTSNRSELRYIKAVCKHFSLADAGGRALMSLNHQRAKLPSSIAHRVSISIIYALPT